MPGQRRALSLRLASGVRPRRQDRPAAGHVLAARYRPVRPIVAACYLEGEDLGAWLVCEGWALAYRRYSTAYVADEERARAARRGMWEGEFVPPWEWRAGTRLPAEAAERAITPALMPAAAGGACCKRCTKGQACGNSCISSSKQCRQPPGCAC